ncbi:MAG: hypothetical protein KF764_22915 [Labilithrix sp.]|nr:hypothetical protein [Labilithrix sp.]
MALRPLSALAPAARAPALTRGALLRALAAATLAAACGDPPVTTAATRSPADAPAPAQSKAAPEYAREDAAWGKFHSKRFQATIPLPDGRAWKIDDHRGAELVAVHAPTDSRLTLVATQEDELMNRQRCEQRARDRGWVMKPTLSTVEDRVTVGPDAYDSRVWVAIDPAGEGGTIEGHVFLFGAFLRRCLLVHLATRVPSTKDDEVLASRLAVGSARIVTAIAIDPLRTTDDASVPRDKPDIRR